MIKRLLISPYNDPFLNLAIEHYLLEKLNNEEEILLLYINDPAVVIGRFQNPWLECTPNRTKDTYLIRRESGGGTVYHDRGNLNFSFIQNIESYDRKNNLEQICMIMKNCGIDLSINKRNDLTVEHEGKIYKISGSAFRHKKDRAFHHGTVLIESETKRLKESITPGTQKVFTKISGTASNRSEIINLNRVNTKLTMEMVLNTFRSLYEKREDYIFEDWDEDEWEKLSEHDSVQQERTLLLSEDWILGKTPAFRQDISSFHPPETDGWEISVSKGTIEDSVRELSFLKGIHYGRRHTVDELKKKLRGQSVFGLGEDELFSRLILFIG
ncbi:MULTISPECIES: lipoate--protein ligase family protein [unclassified Oceanispirochaeta]|uniref:lipoate--protein ligase family protein n=1 Tax=unclassified Oceanispirochaeta TaxID=2635722 RepID=UPI000E092D04|nr:MULTISPECIES: lipoate--protein ligase family protein [unclassified Oceanispirochaeta]MBF9014457.1 lipoate--protein ligase family protein [Oceanispirochaeta sp. M2]NPD70713.1 lipoate--protein ligase family protein [Oceanispirochaeta sp. M1]RDG33997.1 lipoate--protein ligase family protein [Oceanispirochaeta sp. M1]